MTIDKAKEILLIVKVSRGICVYPYLYPFVELTRLAGELTRGLGDLSAEHESPEASHHAAGLEKQHHVVTEQLETNLVHRILCFLSGRVEILVVDWLARVSSMPIRNVRAVCAFDSKQEIHPYKHVEGPWVEVVHVVV